MGPRKMWVERCEPLSRGNMFAEDISEDFSEDRRSWISVTLVLRVRPPGIEWKTGRNPKMGKIGQKIENGPRPKMGKKWPRNGQKMGFGVIFLFFRYFWAIFSPCRAEGHFLFFGQFLPIFGFRPVFHSIPGGLTRNFSVFLDIFEIFAEDCFLPRSFPTFLRSGFFFTPEPFPVESPHTHFL